MPCITHLMDRSYSQWCFVGDKVHGDGDTLWLVHSWCARLTWTIFIRTYSFVRIVYFWAFICVLNSFLQVCPILSSSTSYNTVILPHISTAAILHGNIAYFLFYKYVVFLHDYTCMRYITQTRGSDTFLEDTRKTRFVDEAVLLSAATAALRATCIEIPNLHCLLNARRTHC